MLSPLFDPPRSSPIRHLVGIALLAVATAASAAEVVLDEPFEGPQTTWRVRQASAVRLLAQLRTRSPDPTDPRTSERVVLACPAGYAAHVEHPVGHLPVLDELSIEAVLRGNRPGLQLAAVVVFPRSLDPRTQQPPRTLVHGLRYSAPGTWQRLRVDRLPVLAERQARLMNADPQQQVDHREAYVDRVVLVVPGGPGESLVEVDQLTIHGIATTAPENQRGETAALQALGGDEGPLLQAPGMAGGQQESFEPVEVRRRGDSVSVAGTPLVPRVVEHRGEPFGQLAELGFNTVWLPKTPTEAQLRSARAAKLWVISPPPPAEGLAALAADSVWQTVLAWSLGFDRDALALDGTASRAEEIRRSDPLGRPLVVGAIDRRRRFAQLSDVLVSDKPVAASEQAEPAQDAMPLLGCSPWTQLSLAWQADARRQAELFAPRASHLGWHEPRDLRRAALQAMASGARGLVIRTPDRLGGPAPEASRLADQIRLLNRELHLVEPWLVAGKRIAGAQLSPSDRQTTAWQLGRSRLVFIPPPSSATSQANKRTVLVVAGVPETARAHLLSPAGLLPLEGRLVAGGYQVQLQHIDAGVWVLLSDDARSLAWSQRRVGSDSASYAQTQRGLAMAEVLELEAVESQLSSRQQGISVERLAPLKQGIQQCDQFLAARRYSQTFHLAGQIRHQAAIERQRLAKAFAGRGFTSVPTSSELRLLPTHQALEQSLAGLPRGGNLLAGGDFEDLASTRSAEWQHANYSQSRIDTSVRFVPGGYHGAACLRLSARDTVSAALLDDGQPEPAVWISSPHVPVSPGSIVEITGWVRVTTTAGQSGQLLVRDSLGGDQLAIRVAATTGWQPLRMVRMAGDTRNLQLKFALTGPATADIDAVMIREITRPERTARQAKQVPQ